MVKIVGKNKYVWGARKQEFDLRCIKFELSDEHPDSFFSVFMKCPQLFCSSKIFKRDLRDHLDFWYPLPSPLSLYSGLKKLVSCPR